MVGKHVLVRSYDAGVFVGVLVSKEESANGRFTVKLDSSRRLWKWAARDGIALSGVAVHGLKRSDSKIDVPVDGHIIAGVIEIMPTTETAQETMK